MSSLLFTATRRWPTQAPSRSGRNLPYRLPDKAQYPGSVRTAMLGSGRIYPPLMCIAVVWIGREPHRISQLESRTLLAGPPTRGSAIGTASESCIPGSGFAKPPGPGSQPTLARSAPDPRRARRQTSLRNRDSAARVRGRRRLKKALSVTGLRSSGATAPETKK
jgi:hypothetical protein